MKEHRKYEIREVEVTEDGVQVAFIPDTIFRGTSFERVDGIDYSQFECSNVFVGSAPAWSRLGLLHDPSWFPANYLFDKDLLPMNTCQAGVPVTFRVRGTRKEFAVIVSGMELK